MALELNPVVLEGIDSGREEPYRRNSIFSAEPDPGSSFSDHELKSTRECLEDLAAFVRNRRGHDVKLPIPQIYQKQCKNRSELIKELKKEGYSSSNWLENRLTEKQVESAVIKLSEIHAAGFAYRMSMKGKITTKYPWLDTDFYTNNRTKLLLARYLDSYLYYLSTQPGLTEVVFTLQRHKSRIFQLLIALRKSSDQVGERFRTICHGDLWMGNLMFRGNKDDHEDQDCVFMDFHSTGYLSPASDLVHLLLTSTTKEFITQQWNHVVGTYYTSFSQNLVNYGLVLKHLGTNKIHFKQEVRRALAGEMICLGVITPVLVMCGPRERYRTRKISDRENTVKHLIQMMSIREEDGEDEEEGKVVNRTDIAEEWIPLDQDIRFRKSVLDVLQVCQELGVLSELESCPVLHKKASHRRRASM